MIGREEYLHFCDRALDQMSGIVAELGDGLANHPPAVRGANSPYALLTHCLGVVEFWVGHVVLGRDSPRDRAAEFTATGPVGPLVERARQTRRQLAEDVQGLDPAAPVRNQPAGRAGSPAPHLAQAPSRPMTCGFALQHLATELSQHLGQLEITRDLLRAGVVAEPR